MVRVWASELGRRHSAREKPKSKAPRSPLRGDAYDRSGSVLSPRATETHGGDGEAATSKRARFANARITPRNLSDAVVALLDAKACGGSSTIGSVLDQLTEEFEQNVRPHKELIKQIVAEEFRIRRGQRA